MEGEQRSIDNLLEWAAQQGVSDSSQSPAKLTSCLGHSLTVSEFPGAGGRGLASSRDLRHGELILKVPKPLLFTSPSVRFKDQKLSATIVQILTVCLLYEINKGKNSDWYPYLIHLPRDYSVIASFNEFEKQALQVDDAVLATEKAISKLDAEWKEAGVLMNSLKLRPKLLSFKAWLWGSATISSRALHVPWDAAGCLCPVGDLFNYAAPNDEGLDDEVAVHSEVERLTDGGFEEDVDAYCFYARRHYRRGEQVLLCYGSYTNLELLEHYGFLLDDNPNEKAFIALEPSLYTLVSWPRESLYISHNGEPSYALMSALRLWMTPASRRKLVSHLIYSDSVVSAENETLVLNWLSNKCNSILKSLATSAEEDYSLLVNVERGVESGSGEEDRTLCCRLTEACPSEKWVLGVRWRLKHKAVLAACISYCIERINSLSPARDVL